MKYSQDIVEEVLARTDIVDVISSYIKIQKRGADYKGLCPFHTEKTPSFSVSPSKQIFHCFGCGKGGNAISFVMQYENYTFTEAFTLLAQRAGISPDNSFIEDEHRRKRDYKSLLLNINREAALFFYNNLKSQKGINALNYLKNRGLTISDITKFGLGFADSSGSSLYNHLKEKGYDDTQLKDSGLVNFNDKGIRDRFWNRIIFPIMAANRGVIGFGGRVMGEGLPKYINSPETGIFDKSRNLYGLNFAKNTKQTFMLVCEGYMDLIALQQAGFINSVATLGTALTQGHALMLKRYVKKVVLTYDSDEAGIKAALRAGSVLRNEGFMVNILDMKPYKDPDEFIKGLGAQEFANRIKEAKNSFLWEINLLKNDFDMSDPQMQTEFYKSIASKLCDFEEGLERDNYIKAICREHVILYDEMKKLVLEIDARRKMGLERMPVKKSDSSSNNNSKTGFLINGSKEAKNDLMRGAFNNKLYEISRRSGTDVQKNADNVVQSRMLKKRAADREFSLLSNQKLLLSCMANNTFDMFEKILKHITPSDFTNDFYRELAEDIVRMRTDDDVSAALIVNRYAQDEEKQKEASEILINNFNEDTKEEELKKAVSESILKLKLYRLENDCKNTTDINKLQDMMIEQNSLRTRGISL
ncbi:DNA primase [Johnsonella ignava]|uniref:DNA primase n=1 Tax=Johnsonella ignava TaxID=43995 RepID=UPI0023F4AB6A|nr:DNA primase [Johnsonella ignava]